MGISEIQKKRVFEEVARDFFASGTKPRLTDILTDTSEYFAQYPVGTPVKMPIDYIGADLASNVDQFNEIMARFSLNLDVLYEACADQVSDVMTLTTLLRANLEKLRNRRNRIIATIDDHLFTLYNVDGYYYSVSDVFNDLDLVDLTLTSAFIDTTAGNVTIPVLSSLSKELEFEQYRGASFNSFFNGGVKPAVAIAPFSGAIDGLSNTIWSSELQTDTPGEAVMQVRLVVGTDEEPSKISRIDFDPYGITPVQMFTEVRTRGTTTEGYADFSGQIKTSLYKMSFIDNPIEVTDVIITLRKTEPDYTINIGGQIKYRYIFGAKNIAVTAQVYDSEAIVVSEPLFISEELVDDNVIDAVSLSAVDNVPEGTDIKYYVASDVDLNNPQLGDFEWKPIHPIDESVDNPNSIIRFNGARGFTRHIRSNPSDTDLQLIPLDVTNSDLKKRNPSPVIIPGASIYRITEFEDDNILPASIVLEEGVNTIKIRYTNLSSAAVNGLDYWVPYVAGTSTASTVYGRIDTGSEFFYGGDVGESAKSVYIETYLESVEEQNLILKEIRKIDPNSKQWHVVVYLNGREIGNLPVGTDSMVLPWKFRQGLNHIILTVNIPQSTSAFPNPYIGLLDLMTDADLFDYGTVKLATWQYVDLFTMQYNQVDDPNSFTIYENEIVSRRKPTTNFRVKYSKATDLAPGAIRVRADLKRDVTNQYVTPTLDSYRLRFLYANR